MPLADQSEFINLLMEQNRMCNALDELRKELLNGKLKIQNKK